MQEGHMIKEHKTPFPIIVHVYKGEIDFGVNGTTVLLKEGDAISLPGTVPHDLKARQDSMIRLTLAKADQAERVEKVVVSSLKK